MKNILLIFLNLLICTTLTGQSKTFEALLNEKLNKTVPIIKVKTVNNTTDYLFLDTRELHEFETSHIKNAIHIGYNSFDIQQTKKIIPNKNTPIILYCSVGIRSELIGETLLKEGYTNVFNLYGGIFEWKNQNHIVVDLNKKPTEKVHTFSREWSKWLLKGNKVYED